MDIRYLEMIDEAEGHIRADLRAGIIDKWQFQKEMLIIARAREQAKGITPPASEHNEH